MTWPKRVSATRWYADPLSSNLTDVNTTTSWATGMAIVYPIEFFTSGTIQAMGVYKTNSGNRTGLTFRPAILNHHTDGAPGTVITDFGDIDMSGIGTGIRSNNGSAVIPARGLYYVGLNLTSLGTAGTHPTTIRHGSSIKSYGGNPMGYSGSATITTDWTSAVFAAELYPYGYTGLGTGGWSSLAGTAVASRGVFNVMAGFKFTPDPEGGPGWAWHGADARWQVIGG